MASDTTREALNEAWAAWDWPHHNAMMFSSRGIFEAGWAAGVAEVERRYTPIREAAEAITEMPYCQWCGESWNFYGEGDSMCPIHDMRAALASVDAAQ